MKFTEEGRVELSVRRDGALLRWAVNDTGIGIEPARLEAIFEPFSQADAHTHRRFGGTGLGLAISQKLADLMGGRLVRGRGLHLHPRGPLRAR